MSRPETQQTSASRRPADETGPETDRDEQHCQGCGGFVSADFRRVFGTNGGRVHACPACASMADLTSGATVKNGGGR